MTKEIEKKELDLSRNYLDIVTEVTRESLEELKANDESTRKSGKEIYNTAKKLYSNMNKIEIGVFLSYLSSVAKSDNSEVVRPIGKQGFYLNRTQSDIIQQKDSEEQKEIKEEKKEIEKEKEREKEKVLYPILQLWLKEQGYRTKDTSSNRSPRKWGNPDLTGIKVESNLGVKELEISTIEAKLSYNNWEYNIFEAVAHRRFSNRAYFSFAHPIELIRKLPLNLRYYCELYSIGIIVLGLSSDIYEKLREGKLRSPLEYDDIDITELYSAPYNYVQLKYQKEYCQSIGIREESELYTWGEILQQ